MDNIESVIWDTISESAKTRFDYSSFLKKLNPPKEHVIDCILLTIINDIAFGESNESIVAKIVQKSLEDNLNWKESEIVHFINNAEKTFNIEIHTANVANGMIKEHKDLKEVLTTVNKMVY